VSKKNAVNLPADIKVRVSQEMIDTLWDEFLESTPLGHYEQSSKWAKVKAVYGWQPVRIIISKRGKIIGGVQILKKPAPFFGAVGYVTKGPVFTDYEKELFISLTGLLKAELRHHRIQYLILQPPDKGHMIEPWLMMHSFQIEQLVEVEGATTMIDLSLDLDDIKSRMSPKNRRNIRFGYKKGIKVRQGCEIEVPVFYQMMRETCRRRGVDPNPPDVDFFIELWRNFAPYGKVKLFLTEYNNDIISGIFAIPHGDTLRTWKFGWNGKYGKLKPNDVLNWEIIGWAKTQGYRYYDFVGIDRKLAELISRGAHFSKVTEGPDFFKLAFGGDVYILPKPYYYIYNPLFRFLYSKLFLKIVRSQLLLKFIGAPLTGRILKYFSGAHTQ
jgi:lipid II:glycine glycyltransferase (peptidoglycan interpeptide bridge formation enzyme)